MKTLIEMANETFPRASWRETPFVCVLGTKYCTLPESYKKYGLSIGLLHIREMPLEEARACSDLLMAQGEFERRVYSAIKNHWHVCRYLDEHPDAADGFLARRPGYWYYDILELAEEEYCQELA